VRRPLERCRSVSCSRARRELLEQFALGEELGSRSGPHLEHLQACADCRREVGIDRALVMNLRRALRDRVEGSAPSAATWQQVRSRTVDRPAQPWAVRVVRWGGMVSAAAAAGIMLFAVVTAPESRLLTENQSGYVASAAHRVPPVDEANGQFADSAVDPTLQTYPPPGWPTQTKLSTEAPRDDGEPPIIKHMR